MEEMFYNMDELHNKTVDNRTTRIRHQCKKTTVLSCHRCLINTGVKKNEQV
jgi:hypothetical protein